MLCRPSVSSLVAVAALLSGCDADPTTRGLQYPHEVRIHPVTLSAACPPQATATIVVGHGPCHRILRPEVKREGRAITIHVLTRPETRFTCAFGPFILRFTPVSVSLGSD